MKRIIQLRGAFSSGKSTIVREFIACNTNDGVSGSITRLNGGKIAIIGDYSGTSATGCGCDKIGNVGKIQEIIETAMQDAAVETIIFEGAIISYSVPFVERVAALANKYGYTYIGLYLYLPYAEQLMRLYERSGATKKKAQSLCSAYNSVISSSKKLKAMGYDIRMICVEKYAKGEMSKIIYEQLQ